MTIGSRFISWWFAKDACKHAIFKVTNFSLIFCIILLLSALKLLHLLHNLILILAKTSPSLQVLISIESIENPCTYISKRFNLFPKTLIFLN
jgi:hypothetical protein